MTPANPVFSRVMPTTLYKLDVQGIVYLVDPSTSDAYLYDMTNPTKIGHIIWENPKSKPTIELVPDWQDIMKQKCDSWVPEVGQ
jgi:hypothetical protein